MVGITNSISGGNKCEFENLFPPRALYEAKDAEMESQHSNEGTKDREMESQHSNEGTKNREMESQHSSEGKKDRDVESQHSNEGTKDRDVERLYKMRVQRTGK